MMPSSARSRGSIPFVCLLLTFCGPAVPALAEPPASEPGNPDGDGFVFEDAFAVPFEIRPRTVTAPRREAPEERTPISIGVFSEEDLEDAGATDTRDLQRIEPSVHFKTNTVLGQPSIRGVGSDLISVGADPSVATFVDDVVRTRPAAAIQDLFDVDRVEVVKGPLGTLFGRNATGGAIRIFSKRPGPERELSTRITLGNYDTLRVQGALNLPFLEDALRLRISGLWAERDGYSRNFFRRDPLDDERLGSTRVQLLARPSETLEFLLRGEHSRQRDSRGLANDPDPRCCVNGGILAGGLLDADVRRLAQDEDTHAEVERWGTSLHARWDVTPTLRLTSTSAFQHDDFREVLDLDGTSAPFASNRVSEASRTTTQELQLTYRGEGRFSGLLGLYYLHEDAAQRLNVSLGLAGTLHQPGGTARSESASIFGEGRIELLPSLALTAGVRLSREWRSLRFAQRTTTPAATVDVASRQRERWSVYTPRAVLEFTPNDDLLLYLSVARGFKAGGFNSNALQSSFDPEFLWSYEAGFKVALADARVRLATTAFYYDYDDLQILTLAPGAPVGAFPVIENAAAATLYGVETELRVRPRAGLDFRGSVAFLQAHYDSFDSVDPNNPTDDPRRDGDRLPQAPKASGFLGVTWRLPLPLPKRFGTVEAHANWSFRTEVYYNAFQDRFAREGAYDVAGAHLRWRGPEGRFAVTLFGRNLGDETYATTVVRQDPLVGSLRTFGAPRTFGVEMDVGL